MLHEIIVEFNINLQTSEHYWSNNLMNYQKIRDDSLKPQQDKEDHNTITYLTTYSTEQLMKRP